jgi:small subunit ribosomal protein S1
MVPHSDPQRSSEPTEDVKSDADHTAPSGPSEEPAAAEPAAAPRPADSTSPGPDPAPEVPADQAAPPEAAKEIPGGGSRPAQEPVAPVPPVTPKAEAKGKGTPDTPKARLRAAHRNGSMVEGKVVAIVRGGYEVDVEGITALCPFNQIDLRPNTDQLAHLHQFYSFRVTAYKQRGRRVILSRRRVLEKEARKAERDAIGRLKPGTDHEGTVISLTDYGAFIDLGGVQGMVHVSEITHGRIDRPADRLTVGQRVKAKILKCDRKKGRVSLSLRALEGDPWDGIGGRVKNNEIIAGRLLRVTEFGAFVEVVPGVDGLIHLSEIPEEKLEGLRELASKEAEILVHVLRVEAGKKRISLAPAPEGAKPGERLQFKPLRPGRIVEGVVEKIDKSGVLVTLGPAQTGLIPPAETGAPRGADLAQHFQVGKTVRVQIMSSEKGDRWARLSVRKAERQEERRQLDDFRRSSASGAGSFATLGDIFRKKSSD